MGMKITKGDDVIVLTGRDKGRKGTVLRAMPTEGRVLVDGVNMMKRHTRASARGPGGIEERPAPIHISNVALVDPDTGKPTRAGSKTLDDGRKVRIARRSGEIIERRAK